MAPENRGRDRLPILIALISIGLVAVIVGGGIWVFANGNKQKSTDQIVPSTPTPDIPIQTKNGISTLLFGTNLGLFGKNDQVLTSAATRSALQQLHVRIIRMPIRANVAESVEVQAAQDIKDMGAIPLIILRGSIDANALADNTPVIQDMNRVFGNSVVYYEFGNENDLQGVSAERYTAAWNSVVSQLKPMATNGRFIGPVNYKYMHNYLTTFLQQAKPQPDAVSWHEYTCNASEASDVCIAHIAHWTVHVQDARAIMQTTIGKEIPIMITEWNYSPNAEFNDGKSSDSNFMNTWTTTALQTLAANHVFAAMQYSCTHSVMPLVTSTATISPQGMAFLSQYQQLIVNNQQPVVASAPTETATSTQAVTAKGPIMFSFEDGGTGSWNGHGDGISNLRNSTSVALDGQHSLQVSLSNASSGNYPFVSADFASSGSPIHAGQTITAYVYSQSNAVTLDAKLFVSDSSNNWHIGDSVTLNPGSWTRLTYMLPSDLVNQPRDVGIQFNCTNGIGTPSNVFIDAVGWS